MLILACDTSNSACSACLYKDGRVLAQSLLSLGMTHSQTFMPMVHSLMERSGFSYGDLDAFACAVGPGSFTGIRIGVSSVKAMAMVAAKPAVPVSSLKALAFPFFGRENTLVVAMTDARNRRVFSSAYFNGQEVIPENARSIDELAALTESWEAQNSDFSADILLVGDAAEMYAGESYFRNRNARTEELFGREVQPASVAALAYKRILMSTDMADSGDTPGLFGLFPPAALMPVYRAKTSAERKFPNVRPGEGRS